LSIKPSIEDIGEEIKNRILKSRGTKTDPEKLEALKEKISRNEYFISTDDLVNSILK
jgi:anti-sigma28 factor (negative regulator of flagellin synthesis)